VEIFPNVMSGMDAFLLVVQILIISGLLLAFIWLMILRTREIADKAPVVEAHVDHAPEAPAHAPEPVVAAPEPPPPPVAPTEPVAAATEAATEAHAEAAPSSNAAQAPNPSAEELESLKEKVRYLESRLMEYEIVQEEIGTLSQLRDENGRLKDELAKVQGGGAPSSAIPEAAVAVSPEAPAQSAAAEVPSTQEPSTPSPAAEPNPILESVSAGQIDTILQKLDEITTKPTT
jgi:hypothetical protein